jgi:hypothetical protein
MDDQGVLNNAKLLPYSDPVAHNAALIDNFPERMDRFLNCISQVYFHHDTFDSVITGTDKTSGKSLLRNYESEMMEKKRMSNVEVAGQPASAGTLLQVDSRQRSDGQRNPNVYRRTPTPSKDLPAIDN